MWISRRSRITGRTFIASCAGDVLRDGSIDFRVIYLHLIPSSGTVDLDAPSVEQGERLGKAGDRRFLTFTPHRGWRSEAPEIAPDLTEKTDGVHK